MLHGISGERNFGQKPIFLAVQWSDQLTGELSLPKIEAVKTENAFPAEIHEFVSILFIMFTL
jgi:hypothetical protein